VDRFRRSRHGGCRCDRRLSDQLAFLGGRQYTLTTLVALGLTVVVLYALIVRWEDGQTV